MVQRHNISHSTERHEVQQAPQVGFGIRQAIGFPELLAQRCEHVKHDANTGRVLAQERTTRLVWIDDGIGIRKLFAGQVVIGHHHFHAKFLGRANAFNRGYAVINGDHQVRELTLVAQAFNNTRRQAVAICKPAGHAKVDTLQTQHGESKHGNGCTGSTIGVEIAEHKHPLLLIDSLGKKLNGPVNTSQRQG